MAHDNCRAEMLAAGLPNFGGLFEDVDWGGLHRAYADLDATRERGAKLDIAAALTDMVTYNGGQPLSCHA